MSAKSFRAALNEALHQEMAADPNVVVIGEDVTGGVGGDGIQDAWGGAFGVTKELLGTYGPSRVLDTPITESAFVGAAAGAAGAGAREGGGRGNAGRGRRGARARAAAPWCR